MRRTAAEAEETRRAVLQAAREAFVERGYAAASTTAIARQAGVTRGALYHHFPDKSALFRAVFVAIEQELNDSVLEAARRATTTMEAFIAGCAAYLDFAVRPDWQRIAVVEAPAVLGAADWHAIDSGIGLASMEAGLAALDAEGLLQRPASPELAVLLFGALTDAGLALARDSGLSREELLTAFLSLAVPAMDDSSASRGAGHRPRRPATSTPARTGTGSGRTRPS
jgi:AcrR family transcriptional regulator